MLRFVTLRGKDALAVGAAAPVLALAILVGTPAAHASHLRIIATEVTQGTQAVTLPTNQVNASSTYTGVRLVKGKTTTVRVYAQSTSSQNVPCVGAVLEGFRSDGSSLGTLNAEGGLQTITPGSPGQPPLAQRTSPTGAFTFTLPYDWTGGSPFSASSVEAPGPSFTLTLRARVYSASGGKCPQPPLELVDPRMSMRMDGITFEGSGCVRVATARVIVRQADGTVIGPATSKTPRSILARAIDITPVPICLISNSSYQTTIDVTDYLFTDPAGSGAKWVDPLKAIWPSLEQLRVKTGADVAVSVAGTPPGSLQGAYPQAWVNDTASGFGVAHEFHHAVSRRHAGTQCDPSRGEDWPPDQIGMLQGVALDRFGLTLSPYRMLGPSAFDVMGTTSNCFYPGDGSVFVSPRGWNFIFDQWRTGSFVCLYPSRALVCPVAASVAAGITETIAVHAAVDAAGATRITSVSPSASIAADLETSALRLVVRDAQGTVLADVAMGSATSHADSFAPQPVGTLLERAATVPLGQAARVEIVSDGQVLDTRARSASAPTGRFLSPEGGAVVGKKRSVDVRWMASDPDGDPVGVTVDWSANGGATWRPVSVGPNGGRVALPSDYFRGTSEGLLRLTLNDGFNETRVLSEGFRTLHRAPTVEIIEPAGARLVRRDATMVLAAVALDEAGTPIADDAIRWFDGRRPLGRGSSIAVTALRAGRHLIRARATDSAGRHGSDAVRLRVLPAAPNFTVLRVPDRVRPGAEAFTARIASTLPATLKVRGLGVVATNEQVGPSTKRVRIAILPGKEPLRPQFGLQADGKTWETRLSIHR